MGGKKRKQTKKIVYRCEICNGTQDEPVVACDKCDNWYHFACVGIISIGKKDAWFCSKCKPSNIHPLSSSQQSTREVFPHQTEKLTSPSKNRNDIDNGKDYDLRYDPKHPYYRADPYAASSVPSIILKDPYVDQPRNRQDKDVSISSRFSIISRSQRIELEIIEEERRLQEKRDRQYLDQKYRILMKDTKKGSNTSYFTGSIEKSYTQNWVQRQQRPIQTDKIHEERSKSNVVVQDDFFKQLDALHLDNSSATAKPQKPSKFNNQPNVKAMDSLLQCEVCELVGNEEEFEACLLCYKKCHFACLDIVMIDDDTHYICPECKDNSGRPSQRPPVAKPNQFVARPNQFVEKPTETERSKRSMGRTGGIGELSNQQERFKACDMCDNFYHFSYMSLEKIDNEIVWICRFCKRNFGFEPTVDSNKPHRCVTCGLSNNQERFEPCSVCRQLNHYSCITTTSTSQGVAWICKKCNNPDSKLTSPKIDPIQDGIGPQDQPIVETSNVLPNPTVTTTSRPSQGASHALTSAQIASRHVVTRDLPIFIGKPEQWPMFLSRFENSTQLCGFSDSENLDRLQKCLKGNALEAVRSRLLTAESVPEIMSTLEMLYGRPELIVNSLMRKIRSEPPPKADKLNTLVDFALSVKNVCATLEQANLSHHLSNPALVQELVDKLPTNIKIDWAKHKASVRNESLSTLAQFLYDLAKVISTVTEPTITKESKDENKTKKDSNKKESNQKESSQGDSVHVFAHQSQSKNRENTNVQSGSKWKSGSDQNSTQCSICKKKCEKVENCPLFLSYNVDRRWKEMYDNKLCRKCLGKHGRFCTQTKMCGVNSCIFKHHSLLHDDKKHSAEAIEQNQIATVTRTNNTHYMPIRMVLLRIVPVTLYSKNMCIHTFAYQDDGSDVSMVEESFIESLAISGREEPLCLIWTAEFHRKENKSRRIELEISGRNEFSERYAIRNLRTVESLGLPIQTVNRNELINKFPYLDGVPFIEYHDAVPRILIGSDNAHLNVPLEIIEGDINQPIACKARIGWSIYGPTEDRTTSRDKQIMNIHRTKCPCQHKNDEEMHQLIKEHFSVENFGVQFNRNLQFCSKEDERALDLLEKHTRRIGDRYETALLWRYDDVSLPDSYGMAYKRLQCLERHKLETIEVIEKTIQEYLRKGYASKMTDEDIKTSQNARKWYLPIFTVFYPKKPHKIRVVFDGAAKVNGVSLNSLLLKGPDQLSSLVDILRRFREKKIASTGDITEMFPQIKIRREDVHVQRFLWRNGDKSKKPDQYVLERMTFGANCSPASAQFVKNKNASEFEKEYPRAVVSIVKNHYVDDMLESQDTEAEMIQLIKDVKKIHSQAGFEIRKFLSNSAAVMKEVNGTDGDLEANKLDMSFGTERVLGMWWNIEKDSFTYSLKFTKIDQEIVNGNRMPTKRELLKILMSLFDPLGLLSHYLIHLKIILQDVWRSNLDWDDEISSQSIRAAWNNWSELLPNVEKIEIPRLCSPKMSPGTPKSIELHVFVDAGEKAFSTVAYLRIEDNDGVDCVLVGSKTRVTPLKYLSTPRNELQAAVLGTTLMTSIGNAQTFKIDRRQFWSDASTVLSWLSSDNRKYHQFVAHRVGEILESTNLDEWRWVPSKQNVADEATKWSKPPSFDNSCRWFSGPEFLKLPKNEWPCKAHVKPDTLEEMKVHYAHSHLIVPILIEPDNFSNWNKMHRAMAYVGRFVSILRAKVSKQIVPHGPLTRDELIIAEKRLIRQAQFQDFTEEMVLLIRNKTLPAQKQHYVHPSSLLYKCTPYLDDDGLIRVHGRIDSANNVAFSTKRPIILPRNNPITRLLVAYYHKMYHHQNHRTVYNEIRQKYYVPCLRVVLNFVRNACQRCKNKRSRAQPPQMADLPAGRLAIGFRSFTFVGIDYFGPMHVVIGRRTEKRWGVLITCLTTRAVHIEIAYRMDTESCIMCIRNFMHFRGCPQEIFSDLGTNLTGMDNTLKELVSQIDQNLLASEFTTCYTKWNFNPPASPHMGGVWERMVRSVKNCLYEILPTRHPTEDMLRNLLLEVCNIINSRPLTDVPLNYEDDEIITPNHFILGSSNGLKPFIDIDIDRPILRSKWMENQRLTDIFWLKFVKEFLPDLTRRTKWHEPVQPIQVDDIVLLVDGTNVRGQYPRARVIETFVGSNNQVRRAKIQLFSHKDTKLKKSVFWRPVTSLAKLDIQPPENSLSISQRDRQTVGSVMNGNTGQFYATLDSTDRSKP